MRNRLKIPLLITVLALPAGCGVQAIRVVERSDVLHGQAFGTAGPYERIIAKVHFAVDPALPANRIITDIHLAPRNAKGMVEFSADLYVLKPRNPAMGNGTVLVEISNRGGKGILAMFHRGAAASRDPREASEFGDLFLMKRGFTLVWIGWQFDVPEQAGLLRLFAPYAGSNRQPVTGLVRSEFIPEDKVTTFSLADRNHIAYPAADRNDARATLTVRDRCDSTRTIIPRAQWSFARLENNRPVPDATSVYVPAGLEPGRIYEVVYTAQDPPLAGLGPAAVRDLVSFIKYAGPAASINILGDQRRFIKRAIGFGTSQSGRFLRKFLYDGFNADEQGRKVFDGVWSHVAGAGRGSFNHRFAQPSRDGHPFFNCLYPTDLFPFSDLAQTDRISGWSGGLLDKVIAARLQPRVFYTNGSYEYWGRAASLIHTTPDGAGDAPIPDSTRIYFLSGTQHGPGSFPPRPGPARHLPNPNDYRWVMRALIVAMQDWLAAGKEPPPSSYPLIAKGELVAPDKLAFPAIAGVRLPQSPHRAWRADYGPEFATQGIVGIEPPKLGEPFAVLVPQVDRDGNELAGIRLPWIAAPLGTYTGWNLRKADAPASDQIYSMIGSFFAFPANRAERARNRDPRASIEERYAGATAYLQRFQTAAAELVQKGYLLEEDTESLRKLALAMWEHRNGNR